MDVEEKVEIGNRGRGEEKEKWKNKVGYPLKNKGEENKWGNWRVQWD